MELRTHGVQPTEIARRLGISRATVHHRLSRFTGRRIQRYCSADALGDSERAGRSVAARGSRDVAGCGAEGAAYEDADQDAALNMPPQMSYKNSTMLGRADICIRCDSPKLFLTVQDFESLFVIRSEASDR